MEIENGTLQNMSTKESIHPKLCNTFDLYLHHLVSNNFHFCEQNFQNFALLVVDDFLWIPLNILVFGYCDHDQELYL